MAKSRAPVTQAVRYLRAHKVSFTSHPYSYEPKGGTRVSSRELGVGEDRVIKTLVFQDEEKNCCLVLMHGDRKVSGKKLARQLGLKSVQPCSPEMANRATGYQVGGISPFGTRKALPTYVEASILELPKIYINGGKRGYLVGLDPSVLLDPLGAKPIAVARE